MGDINLTLDLSGLRDAIEDLKGLENEVRQKVGDLASQAHLHIKEQVQAKLHARREMYDDALSRAEEVREGVWVITLDASAAWIEEGMDPHSMVADLLKNNARTAKDGSRYKIIPMQVGQKPSVAGAGQQLLTQALRQEMKKRNIPYKSIERHPDGSPKTGLLHKFNITDAPIRPYGTEGKPGFGKGPTGSVMSGPGPTGGQSGGTPLLKGVRIYQTGIFKSDAQGNKMPALDKQGRQRAVRGIMTFRIVSSKHTGLKWNYPGIEGTHFFEDAERWAADQWETAILPELLRKFGATS